MPPPFTNILLHQNRGSKDNKDCTCDFDRWGDLKKANPACPVQGHSNTVTACVFAPHGKTIVSASWDKTLKIWDVELGTCLTTLKGHSGEVLCVVWATDGSKLVSCCGYPDNKIKLWSPSTGECLNTLEGHR